MTTTIASEDAPQTLVLRCLGCHRLEVPEEPGLPEIVSIVGKPLVLLSYLSLQHGRTARRRHVAEALWGECRPDRAKAGLRHALWQLGRLGVGDLVVSENGSLVLGRQIQVDHIEFSKAVEAKDYRAAVACYTGELLEGLSGPGMDEAERVIDAERFRLRSMFIAATEAVVESLIPTGAGSEAQAVVERALRLAPPNERLKRLELEVLACRPDDMLAMIAADALERWLLDEGIEANPATDALVAGVRARKANGSRTDSGLMADLVGRDAQFSNLSRAWDSVVSGNGRTILVHGSPGLGKSRLLKDVERRLRVRGVPVASVTGRLGDCDIDYALAGQLVASLAELPGAGTVSPAAMPALVELHQTLGDRWSVPRDRSVGETALRHRATAVLELIRAVADERPLATFIDDLHWTDPASRTLMAGVFGRVPEARVLVVMASRKAAIPGPETDVVELEPLDVHHISALIGSLGALPEEPWASALPVWLHQCTQGSPLLAMESLQVALSAEWLELSDGLWRCADPTRLEVELSDRGPLRRRADGLRGVDSDIALALAVEGAPLSSALLARALGVAAGVAEDRLRSLEVDGYVAVVDGGWVMSHDELARAVIDSAAPSRVAEIHRTLGTDAYRRTSHGDERGLVRAARHLAAAKDPLLGDAFRRWISCQPHVAKRRGIRLLATRFLGERADHDRVHRLIRLLPAHVRWYHVLARHRLATGMLVAALATAAHLAFGRATTDGQSRLFMLQETVETGDGWAGRYLALPAGGWTETSSIAFERMPSMSNAPPDGAGEPALSPDGSSWAYSRASSSGGGRDVLVMIDGREQRLTGDQGDDANAVWSPDGRRLAFVTTAYRHEVGTDIASVDLTTGTVRRLTRGDRSFQDASWSPDGTRIAFRNTRRQAVGWVAADGGVLHRSVHLRDLLVSSLLGWVDVNTLVARGSYRDTSAYVWIDVSRGVIVKRTTDPSPGFRGSIDPTGTWLATIRHPLGHAAPSWYVGLVERPGAARQVGMSEGGAIQQWILWGPASRPRYLDHIVIDDPGVLLPLYVPLGLRVSGYSASGDPADIPLLTWSATDTSVAFVDAGGRVISRKAGTTWIVASAGGWRRDSVQVSFGLTPVDTLMTENWMDGISSSWLRFGDPRPDTARGPGDRLGLNNRGDKSYNSGVISIDAFDPSHGLGVAAALSTPWTTGDWQGVVVAVTGNALDMKSLGGNRETPWQRGNRQTCSAAYPVEGDSVELRASGTGVRHGVSRHFRNGEWFVLRLQVYPDASCGVLIDGVPIARLRVSLDVDLPYRVALEGRALGANMLHGPIVVTSGVPPYIR